MLIYQSCCDYVKANMAKKGNCVIYFIVFIKADDIYKDIAGNIGTRLNYEFYFKS